MQKIIGRKQELSRLKEYYESGSPEFVAVYGRRRVGKTFLVDECFDKHYDFYVSGVIEGSMDDQLFNFNQALKDYGGRDIPTAKNWRDAFLNLRTLLEAKLREKDSEFEVSSRQRLLVFIDELPCFDTPRSGFVKALDSFWNSWASKHPEIMLIVCGSATSWMVENIIDSHGGLHNRITREIHLRPFCLAETKEFLENAGMDWPKLMIAQCYMALGGIPYYLSLLRTDESLAQNLDRLFFSEDAELRREYSRLFHALFRKPEKYIKVIECLAKSRKGLTRKELIAKTKIATGEELTKVLRNLEYCDFIRTHSVTGSPSGTNGRVAQVVDFFTLFYLKFCKTPTTDPQWWSHNLGRSIQNDWFGIMYEILCINHISQIKEALRIGGIYTEYAAWRSKQDAKAQIDLLIDRADGIIDICEVKYSQGVYTLDKAEADKLVRRRTIFEQEVKTQKGLQFVIITTSGLSPNKYSGMVSKTVILDDLFRMP